MHLKENGHERINNGDEKKENRFNGNDEFFG